MTASTDNSGGQPLKLILEHISKRIESEVAKKVDSDGLKSLKRYLIAIAGMCAMTALALAYGFLTQPVSSAHEIASNAKATKMVSFSPDLSNMSDRLAALTALLVMDNGSISSEETQALNVFFVGRYVAEPQHPIGSIPKSVLDGKTSSQMFESGDLYKKYLGYRALIDPADRAISALVSVEMPLGVESYITAKVLEETQLRDYQLMVKTLLLNDLVSATSTEAEGKTLIEYAEAWQAFINSLGASDVDSQISTTEDQFIVMANDGHYQSFTNELRNRLAKRSFISKGGE